MNGSYAIYIFLGPYSPNPTDWPLEQNLVGTHAVFANLANEAALRKRSMMSTDLKVTGAIPLTTMLVNDIADGLLASLLPDVVEAYLSTQLDWRVAMFDGTEVPVENVPDLSISVVKAQVQPAGALDEFPTWGQVTALVDVTAGRVGGHDAAYWDEPPQQAERTVAAAAATAAAASSPATSTVVVRSTTLHPLASCSASCSA